jgi:hypothetical protein
MVYIGAPSYKHQYWHIVGLESFGNMLKTRGLCVDNIWVILSFTEGWGKDVCLVPGELNEMHTNALSCIWVELVK